MRWIPSVIHPVIAVTMMLVSATVVLNHAAHSEQAEPWHRGPECGGAPMRDAPFSAEAVTCGIRCHTARGRSCGPLRAIIATVLAAYVWSSSAG